MEKNLRQPIVSVLGHVDHGKTTLLDAIRKTRIAVKEAGGITQGIGASVVKTKEGKKITFLDTPGHAAFEKMRQRGAVAADIALLVVAADDGVKPQTVEAINHIKKADIPFLVAITKTDLDVADIEKVKGQLEKEGVFLEGRGGETPTIEVSGKTGKGIDSLLEMISLVSEVAGIKGDKNEDLLGVVIETGKDKRGTLVSVVIKKGSLKVGEMVAADGISAKIRGLFDFEERSVKEILPGEPCLILGFSEAPATGSALGKATSSSRKSLEAKNGQTANKKLEKGELPLIIKAKSKGQLEAVIEGLPKEAHVINSSIGEISENDIFLAKASGAGIFGFDVKLSSAVKKLAQTEGIEIEIFKIVYKLFEKVEEIVEKGRIKVLGKAEIIAEFPFNDKRVAGSKVTRGVIKKNDELVLMREEKEIGKVKIKSLMKKKDEIDEAKEGDELGILFYPQLDFRIGDMLVSNTNNN